MREISILEKYILELVTILKTRGLRLRGRSVWFLATIRENRNSKNITDGIKLIHNFMEEKGIAIPPTPEEVMRLIDEMKNAGY